MSHRERQGFTPPTWRRSVTLLLVAALLAAGAPAGAQSPRDRFVFALSGGPDTLDPQATAATLAFQVNKSLYDTLVEPDDEGKLIPGLAESWTVSSDGLTWMFKLRSGVKFHHGKTLDAAAIAEVQARLTLAEVEAALAEQAADQAARTLASREARTVEALRHEPAPGGRRRHA